MTVPRFHLASAVSGVCWGLIAYALGRGALGSLVWGGVVVSPLIGVLVGLSLRRLAPGTTRGRLAVSLVDLYAAVAVFGAAVGVFDLVTGVNAGVGWRRDPSAVILQAVLASLWGITLTGYVLLLWPLSYFNHLLLWRRRPSP